MDLLKRRKAVVLVALLTMAGCRQSAPFEPERTVNPAVPEASPAGPTEDHLSLLERLRDQGGVFTGAPLPRVEHWRGMGAPAYKSAFALCSRIGVADMAIQLHVNPSPAAVALAALSGYRRETWRAAHQGCADGLLWDMRSPAELARSL
jgi:hypothetical protein